MTIADDRHHRSADESRGWGSGPGTPTGWLGIAGVASIGAGAIHAAAVGIHAEHRAAAFAFAVVAALQLLWGGVALIRPGRGVAVAGAVLGAVAVAGWALAKTAGVWFVDGLDRAEAVQAADGIAVALAAASAGLAVGALVTRRSPSAWIPSGGALAGATAGIAAVAFVALVTAGSHVHAHGGGDGVEVAAGQLAADTATAGGDTATAGGDTAGDGHDHEHAESAGGAATEEGASDHGDQGDAAHGEHADDEATAGHHGVAGVTEDGMEPVPYDPTKPIDLGGVEGVTPEQQAMAENIVATTVMRLGKWADPAVAEAAGFRSIGDGFTGHEHFVNAEFRNDDSYLDPDRPESLVYDTSDGGRRLVAAMYMVDEGTALEDVPDYGGALMQWHTHENLCYDAEGKVRGLTGADGNCAAGLTKPVPTPMIHVWIEPHPCGPFAALEGVAGGRIPDGEERLCDHAHGA